MAYLTGRGSAPQVMDKILMDGEMDTGDIACAHLMQVRNVSLELRNVSLELSNVSIDGVWCRFYLRLRRWTSTRHTTSRAR
jgi:hypothetical protein